MIETGERRETIMGLVLKIVLCPINLLITLVTKVLGVLITATINIVGWLIEKITRAVKGKKRKNDIEKMFSSGSATKDDIKKQLEKTLS